jgi:hypothetical protein
VPTLRDENESPEAAAGDHVDGFGLVILGKTCRLCLRCETLLAHKAELDKLIATVATVANADYVVVGTADRRTYRRGLAGTASLEDVKAHTSDVKSYWSVEVTPAGWYPKDDTGSGRAG